MGLKERRAIAELQNTKYPELEKAIQEAAKMPIEIQVDWESLAIEGSSHLYAECIPEIYFKPLVEALKSITADDMGAEALKGSLKKIVIQNKSEISSATKVATYSGGVLTLDHKPTTNVGQVQDREKAIRTILENAL
ncbi:MAG: hypothetical protein IPK13_23465 [Deltaproteobacteria bacterium]|nr:hypothetical protein [Deltaproteobacteria bacterium]